MYIFLVLFNPYYGPSPPSWEVVDNIMSSFWCASQRPEGLYFRRGTYADAVLNLYSVVPHITRGDLSCSRYQGFTWYFHQRWGINLVDLYYVECSTPPMIGGAFMCLYFILLVDKCHYWLVRKGEKNVRCKTFLYSTREMTVSWKILFVWVWKRNDCTMKLFPH